MFFMHPECEKGFEQQLKNNCENSYKGFNSADGNIPTEEVKETLTTMEHIKPSATMIQPIKLDSTDEESNLMELAFKLSEENNLYTFEMCYNALKAAQGDEQLAMEYLLN
jgi:hypothetical protein